MPLLSQSADCLSSLNLGLLLQASAMEDPTEVHTLLARLRSRSKVQPAVAARAIQELACTGGGCAAIVAAGGGTALTRALQSSGSAAMQQHVSAALMQLADSSHDTRTAIVEAGVIPQLLQPMGQPGAVGEHAACAIYRLTQNDVTAEHCTAIAAAGGIPVLISALESGVASFAACALGNMAAHRSLCHALVAAGALSPLVALLSSGRDDLQGEAARSIGNLVARAEWGTAAAEAGALPPLGALLQSSTGRTLRWAAFALENLFDHAPPTGEQVLEQPGVLDTLIGLLHDSSPAEVNTTSNCNLLRHVSGALHNLTRSETACRAAAEAGELHPLVQLLLASQDTETLESIVVSLSAMSGVAPCRQATSHSTPGGRGSSSVAGSVAAQQLGHGARQGSQFAAPADLPCS